MNPNGSDDPQRAIRHERLKLLAWGYYLLGGMGVVLSSIGIVYLLAFGGAALVLPQLETALGASDGLGWVLGMVMGVVILMTGLGWAIGGLTCYAGYCIQKRRHRWFILLVAAFKCLSIPFGLILGIFTFILLCDDRVAAEFQQPPPLPGTQP